MILIALVFAFAIELLSDRVEHWRGDQWFDRYVANLASRFGQHAFWHGPAGVALVLALPLLAVALVQGWLHGVWLGLLGLLFAVAALVYSLRYQQLERAVDRSCDALESGDRTTARAAAADVVSPAAVEDPIALSSEVLVQSHQRLFAVVFWFAVLGAVGAVLYRLAWLLAQPREDAEEDEREAFRLSARQLLAILDWLPARLLAISYALAGSFEDALHEWRMAAVDNQDLYDANYELLHQVALGALTPQRYAFEEEEQPLQVPDALDVTVVRAARAIVMRSVMLWGIVIALFTLGGMAY